MAGKITLDLSDDNDILVSSGVLGKLPVVSVSQMTVKRWVNDGLPYEMQGRRRVFPISKAIKWMIEHGKIEITAGAFDEIDRSQLPPDLRDKLASAELKEFKLRKEKGLVVEKEEVERQAYEIGKKLKDSLYAMPVRLSDELVGKDSNTIRNRMEEEISKVLEDVIREIENAV
jgi:phage terminase Nu1 subunit (DNA packaging protein)